MRTTDETEFPRKFSGGPAFGKKPTFTMGTTAARTRGENTEVIHLDTKTNLQLLNCSVRHLLTRDRFNESQNYSVVFVAQGTNLGDLFVADVQQWKRHAKDGSDALGEIDCFYFAALIQNLESVLDHLKSNKKLKHALDDEIFAEFTRFLEYYHSSLDPLASGSQESLSEVVHTCRFELKGPVFRNGKPTGPERVLVKFSTFARHQHRMTAVDGMLLYCATTFGDGYRSRKPPPLPSELVLWQTGALPTLPEVRRNTARDKKDEDSA